MAKKKSALPESKATNAYELLDEVRALILAEPKRYDQGRWISKLPDDKARQRLYDVKSFPACGTIACVAGWIVMLKDPTAGDVQDTAEHILNIDSETAFELFSSEAVRGAAQTLSHATNGAAHIRRFQNKYAAQLKATPV